jgi:segregation and condensation protein B
LSNYLFQQMENKTLHIEAIVFTSKTAVSIKELKEFFKNQEVEGITEIIIEECIQEIENKYKGNNFAFELKKVGGGYQFLSKVDFHNSISLFLNQKAKRKLSMSAMETLSIIAYKMPVTKSEIEQIRGVNSDYSVHKLLEKELINILGKADRPGRPILYGVSQYFLDYFGLNSIEEMPKLKEIMPQEDNEIGVVNE